MAEVIDSRLKSALALGGVVAALCIAFFLGSPSGANASVSDYCGNQTIGGGKTCTGAWRLLYQTYGWGDQHSVCVWASQTSGGPPLGGGSYKSCSGGPGLGVYSAAYWENIGLYPNIYNNAASNTTVHGVALTY